MSMKNQPDWTQVSWIMKLCDFFSCCMYQDNLNSWTFDDDNDIIL